MGSTLSATLGLTGNGTLNLGAAISGRIDQFQLGQNGFTCAPVSIVNGSASTLKGGALQADDWYTNSLVIAGGATYSLNLNGGTDKDPAGTALAFTAIKAVVIAITAIAGSTVCPNGVDYLEVGPAGVVDAAQLWFGGVAADDYEQVYWQAFHPGPAAGWTVTPATAMLLPIKNPGANAITCAVLVIGN